MTNDYWKDLPSDDQVQEELTYLHDYWKSRNLFIAEMRRMLAGQNPIEAPKATPYKIRTVHSYSLAAIVNEKASRFTQLPTIQVVPGDDEEEARQESSQLERSINVAMQEMERRSDGDVWARIAADAIILDEGVERIERAPAAFWPEVVQLDSNGEPFLPFEETDIIKNANTILKKRYGIPIRSVYVPLENFFPIYEGATLESSYEIELRSLRDVLRNPLFQSSRNQLTSYSKTPTDALKTQVSIIHFVNSIWHAYFAMVPSANTNVTDRIDWPDYTATELVTRGTPVLLHAYKHNLGVSLYNTPAGRFGGWKTSNNRIEGVGKGLIELNQATDEVISQVFTNVRAKYWPNMVQTFDAEQRGYDTGSPPQPSNVPEGQNFALFKGETIEPIFKPVADPLVGWLWDKFQDQMGRLGGSPVIFGQNTPGVETGYHQALQITQAEHLDEKIEQHLSLGAAKRAEIILRHIKTMDLGEVYCHVTEVSPITGAKKGTYYSIDPKKLSPLPRMDAQVRKPRPVDLAASIRAAREASDERQGKGPLMSDDTIRANVLSMEAPDIEQHKINIERTKRKLIESDVITAKVMELLNVMLATNQIPDVSGATPAPAAAQAAQGLLTPQPAPTGNVPSTTPMATGMPQTQSQPEAQAGREIVNALQGQGGGGAI